MTESRRRIVGTAGHIDHGKTSLVRAITGIDCDRLPEEKRRGITIDLGFASWTSGDVRISFIDVPGHERFVKNMLAGVGGIDSALLVVAADESIKPQTREHFAICKLLGVPTGVIALTKADLADVETIELVRLEVEDLVRDSFLDGKPIIPVSSTTMQGIDELQNALVASVLEVPDRDATRRLFRLPIDRVFTMHGFGSIVTGTTISGSIGSDDDVEILPSGIRSRARNIESHGERRERARAGERTSINLADVALDDLRRGQQIVSPGTLRTTQILTAELTLLADSEPLKDQTRIRFHLYSAELIGTIRVVGSDAQAIKTGETAFVQIRLESPVVATRDDRFVIRRYSPAITIGGGRVIDPFYPKLHRSTRPELLETMASGSLAERVELLARSGGMLGTTLSDLSMRTGIRRDVLRRDLDPETTPPSLVRVEAGGEIRWLHTSHLDEFRKRAMEFLSSYFQKNRVAIGVPKGEFVQKILPVASDATLVDFLLAHLEKQRIAAVRGDLIDVPGRSQDLAGQEGELSRTIEKRFREADLKPPPISELIQTINSKPKVIEGVVSYLAKRGTLVRIGEGIYLHRDVVAEAEKKMREHKGETIDVGWFKDFFSLSRKIAIPLLEHFDRAGVTRRTGDQRQVL